MNLISLFTLLVAHCHSLSLEALIFCQSNPFFFFSSLDLVLINNPYRIKIKLYVFFLRRVFSSHAVLCNSQTGEFDIVLVINELTVRHDQ